MGNLSTRAFGADGLRQVYWDDTLNTPRYYNPVSETYIDILVGPAPTPQDMRTSAVLLVGDDVVGGQFVTIGAGGVHPANATDGTLPASGYVETTTAAPNPVIVYFDGVNTAATNVANDGPVYLAATDGACTLTPPAVVGNLVQLLGTAVYSGTGTHVIVAINAGTVVPTP